MKSCVCAPVIALDVEVTVTEPRDARVDSWPDVSVTIWVCAASLDDVYVVLVGWSWSEAGTLVTCVWPFTVVDVLDTSATVDGTVLEPPHATR